MLIVNRYTLMFYDIFRSQQNCYKLYTLPNYNQHFPSSTFMQVRFIAQHMSMYMYMYVHSLYQYSKLDIYHSIIQLIPDIHECIYPTYMNIRTNMQP